MEIATLAGGCFWCLEAAFERLRGVRKVISGYCAGDDLAPTYRAVCSGKTGHAEAVQIEFDANVISFEKLLDVFFTIHDPTTLNQQGGDIGTQYRSAIFFHNPEQQKLATRVLERLSHSGAWQRPIVTQIEAASTFFIAEPEHQGYFRLHPEAGYCAYVVAAKVSKVNQGFAELLKDDCR